MKTQLVVKFRLHRNCQAGGDFVSSNNRRYKLGEINMGVNFAQRDGRGKHHDARMNGARLMRVIQFDAMRGRAIRERSKLRTRLRHRADHRARTFGRRAHQHFLDGHGRFRK